MKILGVDYGEARMGIAASDENEFLAGGVCCIKVNGMREAVNSAAKKAKELNCKKIVVGLPLNMNGSEGEKAQRVKMFAEFLREASGLPVELIDERRTTIMASSYMNETGRSGKKRKEVIDTLSAQIILQTYLDRKK